MLVVLRGSRHRHGADCRAILRHCAFSRGGILWGSMFEVSLVGLGTRHTSALAEARARAARYQPSGGFCDVPCGDLRALKAWVEGWPFDTLIVLGMGGSSLGGKALVSAIGLRGGRKVFFADNADPCSFLRLLESVEIARTGFAMITKSGGTAETWAQFMVVATLLDAHGLSLARHIVAVTDPHSGDLRRVADEQGWHRFAVPRDVGGRFSVLTAVGLLPAAFAGIDVAALVDGALQMQATVVDGTSSSYELATLLFHHATDCARNVHVMMAYADDYYDLMYWWRQLWAESLGKQNDQQKAVGPTPLVARGSTDQHSLLQLFAEGPDDKVYLMLAPQARPVVSLNTNTCPPSALAVPSVRALAGRTLGAYLDAAMAGTRDALLAAGRPVGTMHVDASPHAIGAFMQYWMTVTAISGGLYGVDAFNQPGVEEAKRRTLRFLESAT